MVSLVLLPAKLRSVDMVFCVGACWSAEKLRMAIWIYADETVWMPSNIGLFVAKMCLKTKIGRGKADFFIKNMVRGRSMG
ncbi:MAG: hypothetical protein H0S80_07480 [Desulfovibrionaceae bacterium]|nr:hypothetical protein [Desulfovibrionaceae bacterium]